MNFSNKYHLKISSIKIEYSKSILLNKMDLYDSCLNGNIHRLRELLNTDLTIDINEIICEDTLLHLGAGQNHLEIVQELLNHHADINVIDNMGQTPLHVASRCNSPLTAKELIIRGADLNIQDNDGCTPLHCASFNGFEDIIQDLLAHGANCNLQNKNGDRPLDI